MDIASQTKPISVEELRGLVLWFLKPDDLPVLEGFYTISGVDGSGQSTQAKLLAYHFGQQGRDCWLTGQPREVGEGAKIRAIIRHEVWTNPGEAIIQIMMTRDRADHMEEIVAELWNDRSVVCARGVDDNIVYSRARGLTRAEIIDVIKANADFARPRVVIYLDLPVDEAMARIFRRCKETGKPPEKFETVECLTLVREGFLGLADIMPNVHVVDATGTEEDVHRRIVGVVEAILPKAE